VSAGIKRPSEIIPNYLIKDNSNKPNTPSSIFHRNSPLSNAENALGIRGPLVSKVQEREAINSGSNKKQPSG
jgi:hypothetical protein